MAPNFRRIEPVEWNERTQAFSWDMSTIKGVPGPEAGYVIFADDTYAGDFVSPAQAGRVAAMVPHAYLATVVYSPSADELGHRARPVADRPQDHWLMYLEMPPGEVSGMPRQAGVAMMFLKTRVHPGKGEYRVHFLTDDWCLLAVMGTENSTGPVVCHGLYECDGMAGLAECLGQRMSRRD